MTDQPEGKAKGGIARAHALTPEQRRQIALRAAEARWGGRPARATHKGSFKDEFGIDVECYVLNDEQKTAVISQRGMSAALGISEMLTLMRIRQKFGHLVALEGAQVPEIVGVGRV